MAMKLVFPYGETELEHLRARDKQLGFAIDTLGMIEREVDPDLFASLVKSIVGQQISTKAQLTIWARMRNLLGVVSPDTIAVASIDQLQSCGISFRKASYIKSVAEEVYSGNLNLSTLAHMSDEEVCRKLSALKGVGVWTAEMLMLFSMQRPDVVSYGDLAILRGMRMLYHHRKITPKLFAKYKRRYSPYGSVASLYLWAIAGGSIEGMKDYAPKKRS